MLKHFFPDFFGGFQQFSITKGYMELDLQSLIVLLCTAVLIGGDPATPPSPRIWAHIRGPYCGQPR
jgi:hypothetical protein